eukprot:6433625-Prymnesium_polylepis.1
MPFRVGGQGLMQALRRAGVPAGARAAAGGVGRRLPQVRLVLREQRPRRRVRAVWCDARRAQQDGPARALL